MYRTTSFLFGALVLNVVGCGSRLQNGVGGSIFEDAINALIGTPAEKLPSLDALSIAYYPDPVLRRVADPVEDVDANIAALANRMLMLMHREGGVGLAAPQVGVSLRMFVCNLTGEEDGDLVCINPRFTESSGAEAAPEGCMSLPGVTVTMRRAAHVVMHAIGLDGRPFELTGEGLAKRVWQHEVDHLGGRLIIDSMSTTDEIANGRAIQQLESNYTPSR